MLQPTQYSLASTRPHPLHIHQQLIKVCVLWCYACGRIVGVCFHPFLASPPPLLWVEREVIICSSSQIGRREGVSYMSVHVIHLTQRSWQNHVLKRLLFFFYWFETGFSLKDPELGLHKSFEMIQQQHTRGHDFMFDGKEDVRLYTRIRSLQRVATSNLLWVPCGEILHTYLPSPPPYAFSMQTYKQDTQANLCKIH